jgi:hypothetical protein
VAAWLSQENPAIPTVICLNGGICEEVGPLC